MTDTTQLRREFEAWFGPTFISDCQWDEARNCYVEYDCHMAWKGYQAATERATPQWQDIPTAPENQLLLVNVAGAGVTTGWQLKSCGWHWEPLDDEPAEATVLHWMPLPTPPAIRQGGYK